jgi:chemotaxis signal transduction protein
VRDVLLARARKYAQSGGVEESTLGEEWLGFVRSGERYLIESRYVTEVANRELTRLPGAASSLLGLANLRGEIIPVFDLACVLGRTASSTPDRSAALIVLGGAQAEVALSAESLEGTSRLADHEIMAVRPSGSPLIRGITRDARVVLDGRALLEGAALTLAHTGETENGSEVNS